MRGSLLSRSLYANVNTRVVTPGTPVQLPSFHILPGMVAVVYSSGTVIGIPAYIAKHPKPRVAAGTPGGDAVMFLTGNAESVNLDGTDLSQYFVDADSANTFISVTVYENRNEDFS